MKIKQGCKIREIAGEQIIITHSEDSADHARVIMLNRTGAWLWQTLNESDFTPSAVAELLAKHYKIDFSDALEDVKRWLHILDRAGVIE
jgi:hypothetical protein